MRKQSLIDAVETASSIHHGDFSSLRGKSFLVYDNIENNKGRSKHVKKHNKDKITLPKLAEQMNNNFNELRQDIKNINVRLDGIDTRLDYIVKANNLKDR
ncbi:MAG: hypothetical protein MJ208_01495 [Bacilli bacterium]|nr:hypothetical protein [Bacilli bacterium]